MKEYCIQYVDQKDGASDCTQACMAFAESGEEAFKMFIANSPLKRITLITYLGKLDD